MLENEFETTSEGRQEFILNDNYHGWKAGSITKPRKSK
jgi:hypothetical protein